MPLEVQSGSEDVNPRLSVKTADLVDFFFLEGIFFYFLCQSENSPCEVLT